MEAVLLSVGLEVIQVWKRNACIKCVKRIEILVLRLESLYDYTIQMSLCTQAREGRNCIAGSESYVGS